MAVVFGALLGGGDDGGGGDVQTPPPATEAPRTPPTTEEPQTTPTQDEEARERRDLVKFALDDRSVSGVKSIWIVWTITNNSSEKSDYTWDWEAIDANGVRVDDSTQYVTNVLPGQTTTGDFPTTLDTANVKLNITKFDRTASP
ncbi:hypothetical protein [Streptomyces sp. UG1]|uniref:hypothetical protein n=1 Tax=Streptomyces sp. UG1 TaxID=3417652 RepID=UPI003CED9D5C